MSEIEKHLRDSEEGEDLHISNADRKMLVDLLACVSVALGSGKLWFNKPGKKYNQQFCEFADKMARKFANMKVEQEQ